MTSPITNAASNPFKPSDAANSKDAALFTKQVSLRQGESQTDLLASPGTQPGQELVNPGGKTPQQVIHELLQRNEGLMFGDLHGEKAIPDFLINIMPDLRKDGVRHIFIEMFDSKDQQIIDQFYRGGDKAELVKYLKEKGWDKRSDSGEKGWAERIADLVEAAKNEDIEVVAMDRDWPADHNASDRLRLANDHWFSLVSTHMATPHANGKYIVYGGGAHSSLSSYRPGVDSRLGIPSIDFYSKTIDRDIDIKPGQIVASQGVGSNYLLRTK
jgi:Haem-binding uptake, Tiki superfamily, ChaN